MLDGDVAHLSGYLELHDLEQIFSGIALSVFHEGFDVWYELLAAFMDLLSDSYRVRDESAAISAAWQMSLRFASVAVGPSGLSHLN